MRALIMILGMAWLWAHPIILVLAAAAEYGLAAVLVAALVTRLRRNHDGHGRARPIPGTAG